MLELAAALLAAIKIVNTRFSRDTCKVDHWMAEAVSYNWPY